MKKIKQKVWGIMSRNLYTAILYTGLSEIKRIIKYGHIWRRRYYVDEDKELIYCVNFKVACSSILACLYAKESIDNISIHHLTADHMKEEYLSEKEKQYFKFTFVRNPFERLVSCYESKYHTDRDKHHRSELQFDYYLGGRIRKDRGFRNFVKKIVKISPRMMETHFMLQYDLLYDKAGHPFVDYYGKYENLQEEFSTIQKKYNLKELPHYNKTIDNKNWMDYYDLEIAELVNKKYRKDIEFFGYQHVYEELVCYLKEKESKI